MRETSTGISTRRGTQLRGIRNLLTTLDSERHPLPQELRELIVRSIQGECEIVLDGEKHRRG
jgi:hypothetical protein